MTKIQMTKTGLAVALALCAGGAFAADRGGSNDDFSAPVVVGEVIYNTTLQTGIQSRSAEFNKKDVDKETEKRNQAEVLKARMTEIDSQFRQNPYEGYKGSLDAVYRASADDANVNLNPKKLRFTGIIRVTNMSHENTDNTKISDQWYELQTPKEPNTIPLTFDNTWTCMVTGSSFRNEGSAFHLPKDNRYVLVPPKTSNTSSDFGVAFINPAWGGKEKDIRIVNSFRRWRLYGERWTSSDVQEVPWMCEKNDD